MASDPLRSAIERALPCYGEERQIENVCRAGHTVTCPRLHLEAVVAAVAPLLAAERERREAAERDTARLDWLQQYELASVSPDHDKCGVLCGWDVEWTDEAGREWLYTGLTIREAIDAAIAASDGEPDGPEETPTDNGPQEAAHRMEQARRLK